MTRCEFETLVEATQRAFRRFLVALCCGDTALADDIAQEAYIKAYLQADSLKTSDKFQPWLHRIAYNCFISSKHTLRPHTDIDSASGVYSRETADETFRYQHLYAALDRLPPKERSALLLFYLEGYSVKEIAEIVQSGQDAVKQQLSRGRSHLRQIIEK